MSALPEEMPKWYQVEKGEKADEDKGWTPKTSDIVRRPNSLREVINAWNGMVYPPVGNQYTVRVDRLQILSPIQVGGYIFPEGGILPAQVGGVPYIPGSSIRGAFLHWVETKLPEMDAAEREFWAGLLQQDGTGWQPRKIRFESVLLEDLKPYPLHPQQEWQIFGAQDESQKKSNKLSIQWQVAPKPPRPSDFPILRQDRNQPKSLSIQVLLEDDAERQQEEWLKDRLKEMLEQQGIGRGTASGFGRLGRSIPKGKWEIELTGMKPCVQQQNKKENQNGIYRWSPQVLRANLRGYFTRLALSVLSRENAETLTDKVFGGLNNRAQLELTSYLRHVNSSFNRRGGYANVFSTSAHQTWVISIDCNSPFRDLIGGLLDLSSRLGGLGPGWRRPPHDFIGSKSQKKLFRGSEFEVSSGISGDGFEKNPGEYLAALIERLREMVRQLATQEKLRLSERGNSGKIVSIWKGEPERWKKIVHEVCSSGEHHRPGWCGSSTTRPSGYAVRQYERFCLVTVFDEDVEEKLEDFDFTSIWRAG